MSGGTGRWDGPVGGTGLWADGVIFGGKNWSGPTAPLPGDVVHFSRQMDQTYTVFFNGAPTNRQLKVHTGDVTFLLDGKTYTLTSADPASVIVGDVSGHSAKLTLSGGTLQSEDAFLGDATTATGTMVAGAGSNWSNSGSLVVGAAGTGTLTVRDGGQVSNTAVYVGGGSGSSGQVTVAGSGSNWSNSGSLYVGYRGTGTLTVQDGGEVSNVIGNIGDDANSVGQVTVTGSGSKWSNSDVLSVGMWGTGTLTVQQGGQVSNKSGYIGNRSGSNGQVAVTGSQSKWSNSGRLYVGHRGTGTLTVQDGGQVSNSDGVIGYYDGSSGHVTLTGSGSNWSNSGDLNVGHEGTGTLAIRDGGHVYVNDTLEVWGTDDSVVVDRGTLSVGALRGPTGVRIELNDPVGGPAALTFHGKGTDDTFSEAIGDRPGGTGSFCKAGANELTLTGLLSYSGSTYVDEGTLVLPQGMYVPGDTVQIADGATLRAGNILNRAVSGEGTIAVEGDSLLVGDMASTDGFRFDGHLDVAGNTVMLLDADVAELGTLTTLGPGGRLDSLGGVQLGPASSVDPARLLSADGSATIDSNFTNNGRINGPAGDEWLKFNYDVGGAGSYTGNVVFSGDFSPGNSPAAVSLENFLLDPTSSLLMEIGGTQPGRQYDQLVVSGLAELGGMLELELLNDYTLDPAVSYQLITGSTTSRFAGVLGLSPGWDIFYTPSAVLIAVPEPSTLVLLLTGLTALLVAGMRRCRLGCLSKSEA